jgi:hypothetical protein
MKRRIIAAFLLVGMFSGCISTNEGPESGGVRANFGQGMGPPPVPGVKGPYGENVPMAAPYNTMKFGSESQMRQAMSAGQPMSMMQMHPNGGMTPPNMPPLPGMMPGAPGGMPMMPGAGMPPGMMQGGGMPGMMPGGGGPMMPGGMPMTPGGGMPGMPGGGNPFQKASMNSLMPNGGVMNANIPPGGPGAGAVAAQFAPNGSAGPMFPAQRTQVFFPKPAGMKIHWFTQGADGKPSYSPTPLETPGRYNFAQGAIYRLKLTHIPGRPALELFPTLEVVPTGPKTNEFLAHNSVPLEFSEEDFKQVVDRNYIVKVIYLPDPQFQDAAGAGPDEIVSTRLEPGQDPIQEALRRGSILLVLRIGNIDQGLQHSPAMTAPIPGGPPAFMKPPGQGVPPLMQVPFPVTPIAPGAGAAPNPLPVLPGGGNPPLILGPKAPEFVLPPKKEEARPNVPPLILPPPGLKLEVNTKPAEPLTPPMPPVLLPNDAKPFGPPIPADKGVSNTLPRPNLPALPASSSKEILTLPPPSSPPPPLVPMSADPGTPLVPTRPDLPLPLLPMSGQK